MPLSVGIGVGLDDLPLTGDWRLTPPLEYLVDNGAGLWVPYLVVQADLTGWQMYEVESQ